MGMGLMTILIVVGVLILAGIKILNEYERGIIFRPLYRTKGSWNYLCYHVRRQNGKGQP